MDNKFHTFGIQVSRVVNKNLGFFKALRNRKQLNENLFPVNQNERDFCCTENQPDPYFGEGGGQRAERKKTPPSELFLQTVGLLQLENATALCFSCKSTQKHQPQASLHFIIIRLRGGKRRAQEFAEPYQRCNQELVLVISM